LFADPQFGISLVNADELSKVSSSLNEASRVISQIDGNPEVLVCCPAAWQKKRGNTC
jgi:hypothetical protein